jgi:hypothetical protein
MEKIALLMADRLLYLLHLWVMLFCLFGWMFPATRMANLVLNGLVAVSWFGLGILNGYGYCLITDVQWKIKKRLGETPRSDSFVKYFFDQITRRDLNIQTVNRATQVSFYVSALLSLTVNLAL